MKTFLLLVPLLFIATVQAELQKESIIIIKYEQAAKLLGEQDDEDLEMEKNAIERINELPATAAGNPGILFISAEEADLLLGEPN